MPLWFLRTRHAIYYILGIIEVLLGFRFVFKLLGANPQNGFVAFLYSISGIFAAPFSGIFDPFVTSGLAAKSVLEPAVIIGMAVYAVAAWALVGLIKLKVTR
ncbi:MAG TPA: YggT family protein [Clostridia bacterium]|nr:YggT family protein [Clostridia bacterium]